MRGGCWRVAENLDVVIGCFVGMLCWVALLGCFVGLLCWDALLGCFAGLCEALWWFGM